MRVIVVCTEQVIYNIRSVVDRRVLMVTRVSFIANQRIIDNVNGNPHQGSQQDNAGRDEVKSSHTLDPNREEDPEKDFPRCFGNQLKCPILYWLWFSMMSPNVKHWEQCPRCQWNQMKRPMGQVQPQRHAKDPAQQIHRINRMRQDVAEPCKDSSHQKMTVFGHSPEGFPV